MLLFYQLICYVCISECVCVCVCVGLCVRMYVFMYASIYVNVYVCVFVCTCVCTCVCMHVRRDADKSLARPGRKHATATKLGIYSTYSPRSSIHFLARCSNFCKPLKKIQKVVRPTRSPRQQWPPRQTFQLFYQSREQVVVQRGQIRRIGWVIKTLETQKGHFPLGCWCPVSRGIVVQEQDRDE